MSETETEPFFPRGIVPEGIEPPSKTPRIARRASLVGLVGLTAGAVGLRTTGVVGEVGYWRLLWLALVVNAITLFVSHNGMIREVKAYAALCEHMLGVLQHINATPAVRCAKCHNRAALMRHPDGDPDEVPAMPPGWTLLHGRPYCPACQS